MERTKRLLIVVAAVCLMAGAALIVFAPAGQEGGSYVIATLLGILPLGEPLGCKSSEFAQSVSTWKVAARRSIRRVLSRGEIPSHAKLQPMFHEWGRT